MEKFVICFTSLCFLIRLTFCQIHFPDTYLPVTTPQSAFECGKLKTDESLIKLKVIGGMEIARGNSPWSALLGYRR